VKIVLVVPDSENLKNVHPARTLRKASSQIPLGLLYIAAAAEEAGHEVVVMDNYLKEAHEDELYNTILLEAPDCVGFSATILNIWQAFSIAKRIKKENPSVLTVFGGPQPTIDSFGTIEKEGVDCVVRGEGERVFVELLSTFAKTGDASRVPGVLFKRQDGNIAQGPAPEYMKDLDEIPRPGRHLICLEKYERVGGGLVLYPVDIVATSRGCSFKCAFCSSAEYWNRKYRMRSAKEVVDEIEFMIRNYGTQGIYFREDNFTLSRKHVLAICAELNQRGLDIPWECESRVDTLTKDVMAKMADAGCRFIWCGVESGSQRVLDMLCKGVKLDQIRAFYKNAKELGIKTGASFMVGVPGEEEEDIQRTVDLAIEIDSDYTGFLSYIAFPGSPIYKKVCKEKLFSSSWESIRFVETDKLSLERVLEIERDLNRRFRWRKLFRKPIESFSTSLKARIYRRRHKTSSL